MLRSKIWGTRTQKYSFTWPFGFHKLMGLITYLEEVEYNEIQGFTKGVFTSWVMESYQMVKRTLGSLKKHILSIHG